MIILIKHELTSRKPTKASKQKADVDYDGDMEDIDPKYRNEVGKALRKDVDSNKHDDNAKTKFRHRRKKKRLRLSCRT